MVLYLFADCSLDTERRELARGTGLIALQPQVFDLLDYLIRNRERVVSKDDLIATVWGGRIVSESALSVRINAARAAIGDDGESQRLIRTLPRKGIRFVGAVRVQQKAFETVMTDAIALQSSSPDLSSRDHRPDDVAGLSIVAPVDTPSGGSARLSLPDKPSIVVLPFENLSGDPGHDYFVDGMVEEIITALSRIRWLFVIARNSSFAYKGQMLDLRRIGQELGVRYILEGSVRKSAEKVRIAVRLIEAETRGHLWADRFDGSLGNIFELQDEIAIRVAGIIEPTLQVAEARRSSELKQANATAYDLYLRSLPCFYTLTNDGIARARELLEQAINRDAQYAPALSLLAVCHLRAYIDGWSTNPEEDRTRAIHSARRAAELGRNDPIVLSNVALVLGWIGDDLAGPLAMVERALSLNPGYARGWYMSGSVHNFAGNYETAIAHVERSMRLNPRERSGAPLAIVGHAHFLNGNPDAAITALLAAIEEQPRYPGAYRTLAACYAHLGRIDEAREVVRKLKLLTPVVVPPVPPSRDLKGREQYLAGLRLAADNDTLDVREPFGS